MLSQQEASSELPWDLLKAKCGLTNNDRHFLVCQRYDTIMALENHLSKTTLNSDLDLDQAGEEGYITVSKKHEVIPLLQRTGKWLIDGQVCEIKISRYFMKISTYFMRLSGYVKRISGYFMRNKFLILCILLWD